MTLPLLSLVQDPATYYRRIAETINGIITDPTATNLLTSNNVWTGTNTFNPQNGTTTINGAPGASSLTLITAAGTSAETILAPAGNQALIAFQPDNASTTMYVGGAGAAGQIVADSADGDMVLRAQHKTIRLSANNGGSSGLTVTDAGAVTGFGPIANAQVDMTPDAAAPSVALTGFVSPTTATIHWSRNGNQVTVFIPVISGTSNANSFVLAIPAAIQPARTQFKSVPVGISTDNSTLITDCVLNVTLTQFQFYHGGSATGWTTTGLKGSGGFSFSYLLN